MNRLQTLLSAGLLFFASAVSAAPPQLLLAQHFTLQQAHTYHWTAGAPQIVEGTIVVVKVDRTDAQVRQVGGPVLYVGSTPAERANNGDLDGAVIAFVPGHVDLSQTPIFWGPPTLPERVDAAAGARALAGATVSTPSPHSVRALQKTAMRVADTAALYRHLSDLIDAHAPSEHMRARTYRFEQR